MAVQKVSGVNIGDSMLGFSLKLYKSVLDENNNVFMSPFSVSSALLLANLGAKGDTEVEIRRAIGVENIPQEKIQGQFKTLQDSLNAQTKGSTTLATANKLFSKIGLKVDQNYITDSKKFHGSGLDLLDFVGNAEGSRVKINSWVEEQTRQKIKDLLPYGTIQADTAMVLVNAIYFKGNWLNPFEEMSTRDSVFHLTKTSNKMIKMMNDNQNVRYVTNSELHCTAVELPYEDGNVSIVFIRPDEIDGLKTLEAALTGDKLGSLLNSVGKAHREEVILSIPKFKMEATYSLVPVLAGMGIKSMFVMGKADFTKMLPENPEAFISSVIHKAFVEVNEKGTEAAAATAMVVTIQSCCINQIPPKKFVLDRPFLFIIRDKASDTVLFVGRYSQPEAET